MGFARSPLHHQGMLLLGDAGGMVNPMNGEGISYAMESALLAAEVTDRALDVRSTSLLDLYDAELRRQWGGYFTLGRWFVRIMGSPEVMRVCTQYGMPYRTLMVFVMKLMAHLTDEQPSDAMDLVINTLQRAAPAA
jgi:menaquinone-9 beta-reductase